MSKEKTPDDKLREAAEAHTGYMFAGRLSPITPDSFKKAIEFFAKSKEAAEYHQSLQPVVDVEALKSQIESVIRASRFDGNYTSGEITDEILKDYILPHLQPPAPESESITFEDFHGFQRFYEGLPSHKRERQSIQKLYGEYKQSKANSDATNNS